VSASLRKIYSVVGALMLLEFLAQFYTIASSGFATVANEIATTQNARVTGAEIQEVDPFAAAHAVIGVFIVPLTILALIALSLGARLPRRATVLTGLLFLLWVFQFMLAFVGFAGVAPIAGLHGINWAFWHQGPAPPPTNGNLTC